MTNVNSNENGVNDLRSMCSSVLLISQYEGMATIKNAYTFAINNPTASRLLTVIKRQSQRLISIYNYLSSENNPDTLPPVEIELQHIRPLGNDFPYCKILNLPGSELLNSNNFIDLCYCAWVYRSRIDTKFAQLCPKFKYPNLDIHYSFSDQNNVPNKSIQTAYTLVTLPRNETQWDQNTVQDLHLTEAEIAQIRRQVTDTMTRLQLGETQLNAPAGMINLRLM